MMTAPLTIPPVNPRPWFSDILQLRVTAWIALLALLSVTGVAWKVSEEVVSRRTMENFTFRTALLQSEIEWRMHEYEGVLHGGVGLFTALDTVDRNRWHAYVESLEIDRFFPGIQGVGFSKVISQEDLKDHIAAVRAEGFPQYVVRPEGARDIYTSIIYLEPFFGRNLRAFGYDMFSEPVRRLAMEHARDSGGSAMSGMVTLIQETDADVQKGFLIYLPLYRKGMPTATIEERGKALEGFVYGPFRIRDLMEGIFGTAKTKIGLDIFDGDALSPLTLLYASGENGDLQSVAPDYKPRFVSMQRIMIAGHAWTLHFYSLPELVPLSESMAPTMVAAIGLLIDLLLSLLVYSYAHRTKRVTVMAEAMTVELRDKNRDLEQFTEVLAHHLQEPVRLQTNYASRLGKLLESCGEITPDIQQSIAHIMRGGERLRLLLRDVQLYLALSQSPWLPRRCDPRGAMAASLDRLRNRIVETGAVITHGDLPTVMIDPERLADVFHALIDNSLAHGRAGVPPIIGISAKPRGTDIVFSVEDNGTGIPEEFRERVFNVFERLHPEIGLAGTGIGLALVRKIIETSMGKTWIESAQSGGTRVLFSLPGSKD